MKILDTSGNSVSDSDYRLQSTPVETIAGRVKPRQIGFGVMRGQQGVGGQELVIDSVNQRITIGGIIIDGVNNTITFANANDVTTLEVNGSVGLSLFDANDDNNERMRVGIQPDATYNVVTVKQGYGVEDAFS